MIYLQVVISQRESGVGYFRHAAAVLGLVCCAWVEVVLADNLEGRRPHQEARILATIRPLALIARGVAPAAAQVTTLIPAAADPHSYQLKISERQALARADLLLWLGEDFENFLADLAAARSSPNKLTATDLTGLNWGTSSAAAHAPHSSAPHHDHGTSSRDPHIWLNPANAKVIGRALAAALTSLQPQAQAEIEANLNAWLAEVDAASAHARKALQPFAEVGFGVVHDGYRHFNQAFGLHQLASVLAAPNQRLSARKLALLQSQLAQAACLMADADTAQARRLARTLGLPLVVADPLAADATIGDYPAWLTKMTESFLSCFAAGQAQRGPDRAGDRGNG